MASLAEQQARARLQAGNVPTIDLFQTADDIVTLFKERAVADAVTFHDGARQGRSQVIQDSLDRLVAARSPACYAPPAGSGPAVAVTLGRITSAYYAIPRMPDATQMVALTSSSATTSMPASSK